MRQRLMPKQFCSLIETVVILCLLTATTCAAENKFPHVEFIEPPNVSAFSSDSVIQGESDFEKIRDIDFRSEDFEIARHVGHLVIKDFGVCSGFLVGPDLFMTNHHCVYDPERQVYIDPGNFLVFMDYLDDDDRGNLNSGVKTVVIKDEPLDFALFRLSKPLGIRLGWLTLMKSRQESTELEAKVIQHPHGRSKEISRKNSKFTEVKDTVVHYLADTEGGSSGSPVFTKNGRIVVALHHAGVQGRYNEGIRIDKIWPRVSQYLYQNNPEQVNSGKKSGDTQANLKKDLPNERKDATLPKRNKYDDLPPALKGFLSEE